MNYGLIITKRNEKVGYHSVLQCWHNLTFDEAVDIAAKKICSLDKKIDRFLSARSYLKEFNGYTLCDEDKVIYEFDIVTFEENK